MITTMLQIYLYGPQEEGFLDIDPSLVLEMEGLSPLFDEDLSTGEFSLPVEIAWTDRNRRLFGFRERLENVNTQTRTFRCDVYDSGFPELVNAQLTILERSGSFSYRRGKFSASIAGTQGYFGTLIKNKKVTDLHLGGTITFNEPSRVFARQVMQGQHPQYTDRIAFAPVAIEDFVDASRPDYDGEFLAMDTVNNVLIGPYAQGWVFGRGASSSPTVAVGPGHPEYADYWTVPFFRLQYVVRKIFEEYGFVVSGDFVDGDAFKDLYLFNNRGIENYARSVNVDFNRSILPQHHVPDVPIAEFLKAIFGLFSIYPRFSNNNEVRLIYRRDDFRFRRILNINTISGEDFSSTYEDVEEEKKGYTIDYDWDPADGNYEDKTKDLADKTIVATVATRPGLASVNAGRQLTTDDLVFVQSENIYYRVANATGSPVLWEPYAEGLYPYKTGQGERTVSAGCSTLCTHTRLNTATGLLEKANYLGTKQKGSYRNFKGIQVKNDFGIRIFYIQKRPFGAVQYPVSFYHSRDDLNQKIVPYSLALNGEDGLVKAFHMEWQDLRQRGEVVKTTLTMDKRVLKELGEHNMLEKDNVLYLPQKIERTIPLQGEAEMSMMPL